MEEIEQEVLDLLQRKTDNTDELTVRFRNAVMLERVKKKLLGIPVHVTIKKNAAHILNIPTAEKCMKMNNDKKPEIIVFAGPNGSGKTTVTMLAKIIQPYINADEIKKNLLCEDLEAAKIAEGCVKKHWRRNRALRLKQCFQHAATLICCTAPKSRVIL